MKKFILFFTLLSLICCSVFIVGCDGGEDQPSEKPIRLSQNEVTLNKGESVTLSVISDEKLDTLSIKWSASDTRTIFYSSVGTEVTIKGVLEGTSELNLVMSGKIIDTVKVTVLTPELYVRLPQSKIVLTQGQTATVQGVSSIEGEPIWSVDCDKITLDTQGLIARVTIMEDCPDGEYTAYLKVGDNSAQFTIIVGV